MPELGWLEKQAGQLIAARGTPSHIARLAVDRFPTSGSAGAGERMHDPAAASQQPGRHQGTHHPGSAERPLACRPFTRSQRKPSPSGNPRR